MNRNGTRKKVPTDKFVVVGDFQFHVVGFFSLPEAVDMRLFLLFLRLLLGLSFCLCNGDLKTHVSRINIQLCVFLFPTEQNYVSVVEPTKWRERRTVQLSWDVIRQLACKTSSFITDIRSTSVGNTCHQTIFLTSLRRICQHCAKR